DEPLLDPIPEDPRPTDLALTLKEILQFPASEPFPPTVDPRLVRRARINFFGELPDLNGTLYLIKNGVATPYLDVRGNFPDFFSGRGLGSGFGFVAFHPDFKKNG